MNLTENLFTKRKTPAPIGSDGSEDTALDSKSAKKSQGNKISSLRNYIIVLPEKVPRLPCGYSVTLSHCLGAALFCHLLLVLSFFLQESYKISRINVFLHEE